MIPRIITIDTRIFTTNADDGTATYTHSFGSAVAVTRFGYNNLSLLRLDGFHNVENFNNLGGVGLSSGAGESFGLDGHTVSIEQTLALTRGRHSMKFGFLYQRAVDSRNDHDIPTVTYANFAAMLTGTPSQVTINFGVNPFALYNPVIGGFVQDDFKVSRRLTVNLGVRYDFYPVQTEASGKLFNRSNYGFGPLLAARLDLQPGLQQYSSASRFRLHAGRIRKDHPSRRLRQIHQSAFHFRRRY